MPDEFDEHKRRLRRENYLTVLISAGLFGFLYMCTQINSCCSNTCRTSSSQKQVLEKQALESTNYLTNPPRDYSRDERTLRAREYAERLNSMQAREK